jgi:hypothetical protein
VNKSNDRVHTHLYYVHIDLSNRHLGRKHKHHASISNFKIGFHPLAGNGLEGPGNTGPGAVEGGSNPSSDNGNSLSGGQRVGRDSLGDSVQASAIRTGDTAVSVLL